MATGIWAVWDEDQGRVKDLHLFGFLITLEEKGRGVLLGEASLLPNDGKSKKAFCTYTETT